MPMRQVDGFKLNAGEHLEPMLLLDTTGSMNDPNDTASWTPRREVMHRVISKLSGALQALDSAGQEEEGGGGIRTITFAGGEAKDIGDINPSNAEKTWGRIRWSGSTYIVPGLQTLLETFKEEFGTDSDTTLCAIVATDGEAEDGAQFVELLGKLGGSIYMIVLCLGYGQDHEQIVASYDRIASTNHHVRVIPFTGDVTDQEIVDKLVAMIS